MNAPQTTAGQNMGQNTGEVEIDLRLYFNVINRHKWGIASFVFALSLLAILVLYSIEPVYQGRSTLLLESESANVVSIEEVYGLSGANREYFQTQYKILESRAIAERVIEQLKLKNHADFSLEPTPFLGIDWRALVPGMSDDKTEATGEDIKNALYTIFSDRLEIKPVRNSQLVDILFDSHDKRLAALVANTVPQTYIDSMLAGRLEMTQQASQWLTGRLDKLRKKLETSEKKLQAFIDKEKLVDVDGFKSLTARRLDEITNKLVEAKRRRAETGALYRQVQAARGQGAARLHSLPAVLKHPLVQGMRQEVSNVERKINELGKRYGPKHPKMIQARSELRAARGSLSRQVQNVLSGVQKEYEVAKANQAGLEREMGLSKDEVQGINKVRYRLEVLQREVDANRNLYDLFLTRFKETSESGGMGAANARVVDPAIAPSAPYKPKKLLIMVIVIFLAGFLGVILAFIYEHLDNTIKGSADVEEKLGLPVLGLLPKLKTKGPQDKSALRAFIEDGQTAFSESVRTIRTGILLSNLDGDHKITVVTSSVPGEGKSTTAMNLAHAMSHLSKVLLIDADMRRPTIADACELGQRPKGLSQFVAGSAQISEAVYEIAGTSLHVMPAGIIPPNPLELLSSKKFQESLTNLSKVFDHIVIDSAPTMAVSDSLVLSSYADAVIYVIRADSTPSPVVQSGVKRLRNVDANIIGAVINMVTMNKGGRYGAYGYEGDYYSDYTYTKS